MEDGTYTLEELSEGFREHLIYEDSDILKDGKSGFEFAHVLDRVCLSHNVRIVSSIR